MGRPVAVPIEAHQVLEFRVDGPAPLRRSATALTAPAVGLRITYSWRDDEHGWQTRWEARMREPHGNTLVAPSEVADVPQWLDDTLRIYHPEAQEDPEQDAVHAVARARQVARSWRDAAMRRATTGADPHGTWAAVAHVCANVLGALDGDADAAGADGEPVLRPEHLLPASRL